MGSALGSGLGVGLGVGVGSGAGVGVASGVGVGVGAGSVLSCAGGVGVSSASPPPWRITTTRAMTIIISISRATIAPAGFLFLPLDAIYLTSNSALCRHYTIYDARKW